MKNKQKLIKRYFGNNYSAKDYRNVKNEFEKGTNHSSFYKNMQEHWMDICNQETPDTDIERLQQKVTKKIFIDEHSSHQQINLLHSLQRIAAILFIPLLIGSLILLFIPNNNEKTYAEIQCPVGSRIHFELPDGSHGYLNSGSHLKYYLPFKKNRQVVLEGEAFFDVVHKSASAFLVRTNQLNVKVLGTRFNVRSFKNEENEEVTLERGKVAIYDQSNKQLSVLSPDEQLVYNVHSKKYQQQRVQATQYTSWIEGKLIFRDEKFEQVVKRLARWYNAQIIITDKRLNDYVFHATFVNEKLEDVLRLIELTTPITYQLEERKKQADDTFAPKKVILSFSEEKRKDF